MHIEGILKVAKVMDPMQVKPIPCVVQKLYGMFSSLEQ